MKHSHLQLLLKTLIGLTLIIIVVFMPVSKDASTAQESNEMLPPIAIKKPLTIITHGDVRIDDYAWMRDSNWQSGVRIDNKEIIAHLEDENKYTEHMLAPLKPLAAQLLEEMKGRIKFNDRTVPVEDRGYLYFAQLNEGQDYWQHWRQAVGTSESENQLLLDENLLAEGKQFIDVADLSISEDHTKLAYTLDDEGNEEYKVVVVNLETGESLPDELRHASGNLEWDAEGNGIFYLKLDERHRANKLYYHKLGTKQNEDTLIFQEERDEFHMSFSKSSDRSSILIASGNSDSSETYYLLLEAFNASSCHPQVILPRQAGRLYEADIAAGKVYVSINDHGKNFRLIATDLQELATKQDDLNSWNEVLPHYKERYLVRFDLAENHLMYVHRVEGLNQIFVRDLTTNQDHHIEFQDASYAANASFPTYESKFVRISYSSMRQPATIYDFQIDTQELVTRKVDEIPSGFDPNNYRVERVWATSEDGVKVPISLVYNTKVVHPKVKPAPVLLYGYGSYGINVAPSFNKKSISLIDRGIIYAIAHIRGGDDLGYEWYEQSKFLGKKLTFQDFIACSEELVRTGYTESGKIAIMGGSAGGMLMGAVVNARPELFGAVVAMVPFVDVLNTMLDETLPLTPGEYTEWGNPKEKQYYDYIKSYSPYDNVQKQAYPAMLVTGGISDPRVTYWEPAKWVAKLREHNTGNLPILLKTEMGAGHFGPSGITEELKEFSEIYAFVISQLL